MSDMSAKIGIIGIEGRMGMALVQAAEHMEISIVGGVDREAGEQELYALAESSAALIDFSAPSALAGNLAAASAAKVPILIGTTGLGAPQMAAIDAAAGTVPVLQTGNTSLGVTLLAHLVQEAASRLGADWDIEIVEMHHRMKVDAPSGTALLLGAAAAKGRGQPLDAAQVAGRAAQSDMGARKAGEIGFASLRGGTVAGEHAVMFAGDEERLTLSHQAENRMIFARGALKGALWLIGKAPGRYTMNDVLSL